MLLNLDIEDFILIDKASINFTKNLNVISGESGAGKSILVNALSFILGERADKSFIRTGQTKARIQAMFDISNNLLIKPIILDMGIECEDNTLIVSRSISVDGKSDIRINGTIVNLSMLKNVTKFLMDICGQHEHQLLKRPESHLQFVDLYAGLEVALVKEKLKKQICEYNDVQSKIKMICGSSSLEREIDMLSYQLNEIEDAHLVAGEDETLMETLHKMQNVQKVSDCVKAVNECIVGNDANNVLLLLSEAKKFLGQLSAVDNQFYEFSNRIESARLEIEDVVESCNQALSEYDFDEQQFNEVDRRIELIKSLKRKYGDSIAEVLKYKEEISGKLDLLKNSEEMLQELLLMQEKLNSQILDTCAVLSEKRRFYAEKLQTGIIEELKKLGMPKATFVIDFKEAETFGVDGVDIVEFLFSANLGEEPRPLTKVISGGEISRFMLAFKVVLGAKNLVLSMLFDEIDSGVGGEIGFAVSCKLASIAKSCQVIAVTHLSSIGAMADNHIFVEKKTTDNKTVSIVRVLDENERIEEISRLSGGTKTENAILYAKDLIDKANDFKQSL